MSSNSHFDIIVIGSGIGGLTTAGLLSKLFSKNVLILEQHFKFGGFTHTFKRKDWEWDVGIHYIGEMEHTSLAYNIVNFLTDSKLEWYKMEEPFEEFIYPDTRFLVFGNQDKFLKDLIELFPNEKQNLIQYFDDIEKHSKWLIRNAIVNIFTDNIQNLFSKLSKKKLFSTKEYLDSHFKDEVLKSILVFRWGDYGLPPSKSSFSIHSLVERHYWKGGWYPIGGSGKFAQLILESLQNSKIQAFLNHRVDKILIKDNQSIGVEVSVLKGEEVIEKKRFYSELIVSNIGLYNTYSLIEEEQLQNSLREKLNLIKKEIYEEYKEAISNVTLYLGLKEDPKKIGIQPRNYWIYDTYDHEYYPFSLESFPKSIYISFPSSKNPEAKAHTAEIISFIDYSYFERWKHQKWKNRDEEYQKLKEEITERLIVFASKFLPTLKENIVYKELSTPITNEFFTLHPKGSIYGIPFTKRRIEKNWITPNTIIKNLYITGADSFTPGFVGAMMGGFFCTAKVIGLKSIIPLSKLLKKKSK